MQINISILFDGPVIKASYTTSCACVRFKSSIAVMFNTTSSPGIIWINRSNAKVDHRGCYVKFAGI